jgi:alkane 1-monooxygenase
MHALRGDPLKTYTYTGAGNEVFQYADRWRARWLLSVLIPMLPVLAIAAAEASGWRLLLWAPLVVIYGLIPLLDWLVGTDTNNPPEEVVAKLEHEAFYRWLTYLAVPVHVGVLVACFWYAMVVAQGFWEILPIILSLGFVSALGINTGHELGHKGNPLERVLAQVALSVSGYGHFRIEHNLGHHVQVATPEDSASARMGESVYRFALREVPGAIRRSWRLESARLARSGRSPWSPQNEILQSHAITLVLQGGLVVWLGWAALPWLVFHDLWAWFQLTGVNYIEHYGLLRERREGGGYERCRPRHSWNSNHSVSNVLLFHLQRHSDHHAHAERRYQSLRHFDEAPQLPSGYMGMLLLSYFPALYFRVMDPRLLAVSAGDLRRVNIDPDAKSRLTDRYAGEPSSPK